ncbi:c-type cytochrome [Acidicapsa acidisoli]|uniref:c-type cytochrome n=1 Tax=Acidicapsa acidisoli TaxID=1615681 RepID=UPI0021E051BF|nr:c-type cytochrome [Acidicapsa acidisoli]
MKPIAIAIACALPVAALLWRNPPAAVRAAEKAKAEKHAETNKRDADWPIYGGEAANDHYSALTQINRSNVGKLQVAWTFDTREKGGMQCSPLIVGRTLYGYTPTQKVIAIDAVTGKLLWTFDSGIAGTQPARGLTYWHTDKESRLFAGVMNYLYALDPATGQPIPGFGEGGKIDLRKQLRGDYQKQSIALTTPGVIYKDLIIVGGRNPETHPAPPGDIRAFDVHTGAMRWSFHTIPHPGEEGYSTWPADAWKKTGAANNWAGMTVDVERGIVYAPTGSAVFDFYGADRIGDDLYANTLLALDANTGKRIWHFQGVHHDIWDRDFPSPPTLVTVTRDGKQVDAVAQTTKQAYIYLFDRVTGKPLFPIQERPYPPSDVPGEVTSPTQPLPLAPEPFGRQILTQDMLTNRTAEAHQFVLNKFKAARSNGQFQPFTVDKETVIFPGFDGGAEWGGSALDPSTDVLYVNENEMAWLASLTATQTGGTPGERAYRNLCSVCHGVHREGAPPAFPALTGIDKRLSDKDIALAIHQGKGRMPGFPNIDDTLMPSLLAYLKSTEAAVASGDKQEMSGATPEAKRVAEENPAGAATYQAHCSICHGDHREGITPSFPALLGLGNRMTKQQAIEIIQKGKGRMPGFTRLTDPDLDSLLKYMGVSATGSVPTIDSAASADSSELRYQFTGYRKFLDQDGYPAISPPWGTLNAVDLNTGKYLWKIPLGEYPELAAAGMKNTGSENYGGPIVTAGGVLFIGATVFDKKMRAFDSHTGKLLWETTLPYAGVATPATYMIDGKQYVVIATGGGRDPKSPSGGEYVAFSLP